MNIKIETMKATITAGASMLALAIGDSYKHIAVLLLLMAVDTIIGWIKGIKLGNWKSSKARWGAVGKIVELLLIACLYGLDWVFAIDWLKYVGIYYFGICEIASMFENFAEMGGNVPSGTIELLKTIQYSVGSDIVKKIRKVFEKEEGNDDNKG